jgi:hypothetical protein
VPGQRSAALLLARPELQRALVHLEHKFAQIATLLDPAPAHLAGEARESLAKWNAMSPEQYVHRYQVALVALALGGKEPALDWLDRAGDERRWIVVYLKVDLRIHALRSHPR